MGKVIKGTGEAPPPAATGKRAGIIDKDSYAARSEAAHIREQAQKDAQALIDEAHEEAEAIRQKAHDEGLAQGRSEGAAELTQTVTEAAQRFRAIEEQVEPQLRELALKIARKILGSELQTRPEAIVDMVRQALSEKARLRTELLLRVHPEDAKYIKEHKAELLEVLSRSKDISIREDPEIERHGVIIETDAGRIDAQLETQLAVFERVLLGDDG